MIATLDQIAGAALSTRATIQNSYDMAADVVRRGVPGCFVECGVYAGAQVGAMALALTEAANHREIHLFDSFQGFPHASEQDGPEWVQRLGAGSANEKSKPLDPAWGFNDRITPKKVLANLEAWGFLHHMFAMHCGWFADTVPGWDRPIALLRLDGDLYESTKVCLEHLYPHLSPGGVCIIDDYALPGCRKAVDEYFFQVKFDHNIPSSQLPIINEVVGGGGPVWFRKGEHPIGKVVEVVKTNADGSQEVIVDINHF